MFIVHIAGRLGKDPETRFTPSGQKVTSFNIATTQRKGKEDITTWVRVTVWGDRFDKIISYLKKGSAAIVVGKMNPPSSYTDKEGRTQISLEMTADMIEFSPFGNADRAGEQSGQQGGYTPQESGGYDSQYSPGSYKPQQQTYGSYTNAGQGHGQHTTIDDDALPF